MSKKEEIYNRLIQTIMKDTKEERAKGNITVSQSKMSESITAKSKRSALTASALLEGSITFDDEVAGEKMSIHSRQMVSPTISAFFLDDGDLYSMKMSFIVHNQIGHETEYDCFVSPGKDGMLPRVYLVIMEYEQGETLLQTPKNKIEISYCHRLSASAREYCVTKDGHEAWSEYEISFPEEKLNEWKEQLLLEYQTSDAKVLAAVLTFLSKIHKHSQKEDDDTYAKDAFSRMIIACLEALGKYENEVANSVADDLGLKNADAIKHVLAYLRRK